MPLTTPASPHHCHHIAWAGDIVFLGSDGVADNFDPVMVKTARAAQAGFEVRTTSAGVAALVGNVALRAAQSRAL